jgi:O-antigen/teichoic acid export membrane protein
VAWGLAYTGVVTVLQFVQGIVLVPLYLRHIDLQIYGAWLATGNVIAMLALVDPGIGDIVRLRASKAIGARDSDQAARTIGTGLLLMSVVLGALGAAGLLAIPLLPRVIRLNPANWAELNRAIVVALVGTGLTLFGYVLGNLLEATQRQRDLGLATIASMLAGIAATVWFLVHSSLGVMAIALGAALRGAIQVLLLVPLCVRALRAEGIARVRWSVEEAREIRGVGVATFISRVVSTTAQQADTFLAALLLGPAATVMLSVASKPKDILQSFPSRLNYTAAPAIAHRVGEDTSQSGAPNEATSRAALRVVVLSISLAAILMAGYVGVAREFIGLWVGEKLFAGNALIALLGTAAFVITVKESLGYAASAYGRLADLARLNTIETIVRVSVASVLFWAVGLVGAPLGAIVASVVILAPTTLLLVECFGDRRGEVTGPLARLGAAGLILVGVAAAAGAWGGTAGSWRGFLFHGLLVVACSTVGLLVLSSDARNAFAIALERLLIATGLRRPHGVSRGAP